MVFAYDSEMSLQSATELVNTASTPDTLTDVADLDDFLRRYQYTGRHERTRAELESVRDLRQRLRTDDFGWHLHAVDYDDPLAERIKIETAMAMIDVIRADETSRLGVCADDGCDGVVLDLSRNRSRRYCSTACGNRNAVAAYRARKAE
jgi:predicted RNA-binding Zn ribbon-like protein